VAAGKDYRDSVLKDAKTSLTVIAGGDPDLRQAVTDGEVKQVRRGQEGCWHLDVSTNIWVQQGYHGCWLQHSRMRTWRDSIV
jgi:hypothetical protein